MLALLETGQALYVLAAVCLLGIGARLASKNLYKRLLKETGNMTMTKNKSLKELKQRAENTYRMNQGMRDSGSWLEHQLYDLKFAGISLAGWNNVSGQLTWLCLLLGGVGAFFSYWFRLDTYYVVMYGGGAVLMAMLTMLFDNGNASGKREQLTAALQDYLENVLCPRLSKNLSEEDIREETGEMARGGNRVMSRMAERGMVQERSNLLDRENTAGKKAGRAARREASKATTAAMTESGPRRDVDYLKRSLEQIAASREKNRMVDENWMKDLKPEEVQLLGEILKEYLV